MGEKIKLLIVDDSMTTRALLEKIFQSSDKINIIGSVGEAQKAAQFVVKKKPDVITLDITMPGIDGLTFLEKLMKNYPTPVVMFSSYTSDDSYATETALKLGAVDYMLKPTNNNFKDYEQISKILINKIIRASEKVVSKLDNNITFGFRNRKLSSKEQERNDELIIKYGEILETTNKIVLIGSSTGGTDAIAKILDKFPPKIPPIIIVQHMPANYTKAWAGRLSSIYNFEVKEAEDGDEIRRDRVYIAPGGKHIILNYTKNRVWINTDDSPSVNSCKPSIDILFKSVKTRDLAERCIGIILTGMGSDGADGMLSLKNLGGFTIAQDKKSCLIYGMPKAAIENKSVSEELDIKKISDRILELL